MLRPLASYHQCVNDDWSNECRRGPGNNAGCAIKELEHNYCTGSTGVGWHTRNFVGDKTKLSLWRSPSAVPQYTHNRCPSPDSWETSVTRWTGQPCDIGSVFQDMQRMSRPSRSLEYEIEVPAPFLVVININIRLNRGPSIDSRAELDPRNLCDGWASDIRDRLHSNRTHIIKYSAHLDILTLGERPSGNIMKSPGSI